MGEDKLTDLINMDHYLTVRHFTVDEELETFNIYIYIYIYIIMLDDTLPPILNAVTLRTFKEISL